MTKRETLERRGFIFLNKSFFLKNPLSFQGKEGKIQKRVACSLPVATSFLMIV